MENRADIGLIRRVRKTIVVGMLLTAVCVVFIVAAMDCGGKEAHLVLWLLLFVFALGQLLIWQGGKVRATCVAAIGAVHSYVWFSYCVPAFFIPAGGIRQMLMLLICCVYIDLVLCTSYFALTRCARLYFPKDESEISDESKGKSKSGLIAVASVVTIATILTIVSISINVGVMRAIQNKLANEGISSRLIIRDFALDPDDWRYKIHFRVTENDVDLNEVFWMLGYGEKYYFHTRTEIITINYDELADYVRTRRSTTPN